MSLRHPGVLLNVPRMSMVMCLTTCRDRDSALTLATTLVDERLAACVSIVPGVTSVYRWQGVIEQCTELQLQIKTTLAHVAALKSRLQQLHTYEVPELLVLHAPDGLPSYLDWIEASVRPVQAP